MYAESPDEYLTFKMSDDGDISLMESVYSNSISDFIEKTLIGPNSIPVCHQCLSHTAHHIAENVSKL